MLPVKWLSLINFIECIWYGKLHTYAMCDCFNIGLSSPINRKGIRDAILNKILEMGFRTVEQNMLVKGFLLAFFKRVKP